MLVQLLPTRSTAYSKSSSFVLCSLASGVILLLLAITPAGGQETEAGTAEANAATGDAVSQEATRLEAELGKYRDTTPEAGAALYQLTELYHQHARVFGLVRSAQRFVAAQTSDPRHAAVMLKLLDGLESLSRHQQFTVIARQFLTRHPNAPQCADVQERLASTLEQMGEREDAAEVYRDRWQRTPNPSGRDFGRNACRLFSTLGNAGIIQGATLAEELFDRLPKDEYAKHIGLRSYHEWRRARQWGPANVIGNKLIQSNLLKDAEQRREILRTMAENYGQQGQHSNAVEVLKKVRAIRDDQWSLYYQIQRMYDSAAPASQIEPLVNQYVTRHKDRDDRNERVALLAIAWNREKNTERALVLFRHLLSTVPQTQSVASYFVQLNGTEPDRLKDTEQALLQAIAKKPKDVWYLRYQLGFALYRDRMKDDVKARRV
ncbi:MAG: hypothetical protein QF918_16250, partial [Pirellulaceae bacterium]|nr:hypothetical protein [Pirellulaceae bacterium]